MSIKRLMKILEELNKLLKKKLGENVGLQRRKKKIKKRLEILKILEDQAIITHQIKQNMRRKKNEMKNVIKHNNPSPTPLLNLT